MARLLLLSIKDNDAAEAIIKAILKADSFSADDKDWGDHVKELGTLVSAYSKIEWVLARPLAFCQCVSKAKDNKGWGKTKRFGWWVHAGCNRCSKMVVDKFVGNLMNGHHNLLAEYQVKQGENTDAQGTVGNGNTP
jgi:hypothetical protein